MNTTHFWGQVRPWLDRSMALLGSCLWVGLVTSQTAYGMIDLFNNSLIVFEENFEPPGDGTPDETIGAGSRSEAACTGDESALRALMPERNYGLTFQSRPSLFVDMPVTTSKQVVLAFRNESGTHYERAFLPLDGTTGPMALSLPSTTTPLTVGENYQWSLVLVCGETVQPDDPVLTGWVQRVDPGSLATDVQQMSQEEQLSWYAQQGYWYDFVSLLSETSPDNLLALVERFLP